MSLDLTKYWEEKKIYKFEKNSNKQIFSIDTPPPTISGLLHIGHVFSYTHTDFIARFQRMIGKNVFYPIGFDCNGLPTEKLVEKTFNKRAKDYENSEDFKKKCEEVIENSIPQFEDLFKKIGLSIDFDLKYNTMDERSQKMAIAAFLNLYEKDEIYSVKKPVFWDWIDGTAISQAEIEDKEFDGEMHDIVFKQENGENLIISTTRPELLYSCFCIFIHPDDLEDGTKYSHLKNSYVYTPLYNKKVPILADEDTIKEKGTGAMMCCAFGDELDLKRYEKYSQTMPEIFKSLEQIFTIQENGIINPEAVKILSNYDSEKRYKIEEFRKLLVAELKEKNLLINSISVKQIVKCAERSSCKLEIIPKGQTYIKTLKHKDALLEQASKVNWIPKEMFEKIKVWIESLRFDWCISRQRSWGIKIPVVGLMISSTSTKAVLEVLWDYTCDGKSDSQSFLNYHFDKFEQIGNDEYKVIQNFKHKVRILSEEKKTEYEEEFLEGSTFKILSNDSVLDTWFTSSLTPQINALYGQEFTIENALEKAKNLDFATMDLRPQAHEIIRTWAFGTITQSYLNYGSDYQSWRNIMISGWCLAKNGGKMSKSKGNIIDPNKLIDLYEADVVRYWAANSNLGADTRFDENIMKIGKKLVTKLINVIKFAELFLKPKNIEQNQEENIEEFALEDFQARNIAKIRCAHKAKCILHHHERESIDLSPITELMDIWIMQKFYSVVENATKALQNFDYFKALQIAENFFWRDYCDNYVEICKVRAYGENSEIIDSQHLSALTTIAFISVNLLKLFAIYLPFTAEKLYLEFAYQEISVHEKWIKLEEFEQFKNYHFASNGEILIEILNEVRKFKTQNQLSIKDQVDLEIFYKDLNFEQIFDQISFDLRNVANLRNIKIDEFTNDDLFDLKLNENLFLRFKKINKD
jgi:valyl-tRNA synthetase